MIYWGATAATGGLNNQQYFCPSTVVLPVELSTFKSSCDGTNNHIFWRSETETRLDHYELEYTFDGQLFYPLQNIQASGNSEDPIEYNFTDPTSYNKQVYYRITSVDQDGKEDYSELISAFRCSDNSKKLVTDLHTDGGNVTIHFSDNSVMYQLFDLNGKSVTNILNNNELPENQLITGFSQGIYLLKAWNKEETIVETHRVLVQP